MLTLTLQHAPTDHLRLRRWEYRSARAHCCASGAHRGLEISWVESGQVTYRIGRSTLSLAAGSVMLVPPQVEHATGFPGGPVHAGSIRLSARLLAEITQVMGRRWQRRRLEPGVVPHGARIVTLARLLLEESDSPADGARQLVSESLAEALAVEVLRNGPWISGRTPRTDPRIAAAIERVESCYEQSLTVDDLARSAGMSRFHFSRRFREVVGQSPYRYLLETRLSRAAALLRGGHHNVTEAALSVGFTDLSRFSRMFREWSGQPPHCYGRAEARSAVVSV